MPFSENINIAAQVIFGIVVIILLYVITLVILNIDSLVSSKSIKVVPREMSVVIDGYATASYLAKKSYNTINPFVEDFVKIGRSINTHGGAQFTYQFWFKMEDTDNQNIKNQVLLLKGDTSKYKVGFYDMINNQLVNNDIKNDYVIKCPLIRFGSSYKEIVVEFNTNRTVNYKSIIRMNPEADPISKRNALSLLPINWYLFTFIFEDNFSTLDSSENGIKFTFFMNDFPYHSVTPSSDPILRGNFLKQNEGNLTILPGMSTAVDFIKMGNVKYYNYALNQKEITKQFTQGPPKHSAFDSVKKVPKPAYLTAYNKMDIYNY
jgi:hypothetical protein